jgi:protein-tyrosine phosphatase
MTSIAMHETSVRAIVPIEGFGNSVICGLPGLVISHDGTAYLDPEHADTTFEYLHSIGVVSLYLLMEDFELPPETRTVLRQASRKAGVSLIWLPIVDFGRPDAVAEKAWKRGRKKRHKQLQNKDNIAVACLYGAGRSGMMAAAMVAEEGMAASKAVRYVRKYYGEAVGSIAQEKWVASGTYLT